MCCALSRSVTENMDSKSEEEKLLELRKMLLLFLLNTSRTNGWMAYTKRNDPEWIIRNGLSILLTEDAMHLVMEKCEEEVWCKFGPFIEPSSVSSCEVQCSLVRLCTSVSERVGQNRPKWNGHLFGRLLCWVVGWMVRECEDGWSDETIDCVVNYLVIVLESDDLKMAKWKKWAILTGEMCWVKLKLGTERRDRLRSAITRNSTHIDTETLNLANAERYQLGWCARWCEDNLLGTRMNPPMEQMPLIKLSHDRFEARNDALASPPVRSQFPVKSNVYFYEVTCVANEVIQVGWSTRGVDYKLAIGLVVANECFIEHNYDRHHISIPSLCPSNVVGCLLDVDNSRFMFYLNGRALEYPTRSYMTIFPEPYFATALLSTHQQCHFNFGQSAFKYPPGNIEVTTFDKQSEGDAMKYRLTETEFSYSTGNYWFKHIPVDNQVSLFFSDEMQDKFDNEVRRVEEVIENDKEIGNWGVNEWEVGEMWSCIRYVQAIIEVIGKVGESDKVDVMARWVGRAIESTVDKVYQLKLIELLYPYLQLIPTQSTLTQHRSICIVLLHLFKCCRHHGYEIMKPIHNLLFRYLTRTLTSTSDQWTQLFALIALGNLDMSETEKEDIKGCNKIGQMVKTWRNQFEGKNVLQLLKSKHKHRLNYQLYHCSYQLPNSTTPPITNHQATLNPLDQTPHLTLSPCHLSARSDWHWQSVRSVCQVSAYIYYFEVVLLTAGPMTIGWATRRTELTRTHVGGDDYSIGFDGFHQCIRHKNTSTPLKSLPRWKAGDIVGCLLDLSSQRITFSLNNHSIPLTQTPYFSTLPYHASVSLSPHQQVYFNFGQCPFLHPPLKNVDYLDFHYAIQTGHIPTLSSTNSSVQLHNVQVTNSQLLCHSTNTVHGNLNYIQNALPPVVNFFPESSCINASQSLTCNLCHQSTSPDRLLRFVCCVNLCFCRKCLDETEIQKCPKCNPKNRSMAKGRK